MYIARYPRFETPGPVITRITHRNWIIQHCGKQNI